MRARRVDQGPCPRLVILRQREKLACSLDSSSSKSRLKQSSRAVGATPKQDVRFISTLTSRQWRQNPRVFLLKAARDARRKIEPKSWPEPVSVHRRGAGVPGPSPTARRPTSAWLSLQESEGPGQLPREPPTLTTAPHPGSRSAPPGRARAHALLRTLLGPPGSVSTTRRKGQRRSCDGREGKACGVRTAGQGTRI